MSHGWEIDNESDGHWNTLLAGKAIKSDIQPPHRLWPLKIIGREQRIWWAYGGAPTNKTKAFPDIQSVKITTLFSKNAKI